MLDALRSDLRFSLRSLARRPGFAASAIVVLALGIGANTAIFSVAYGVLLRPLPWADPERLVLFWPGETINKQAALAVEERMRTVAASTAFATWAMPVGGDGETPEIASVGRVSPHHFAVLGVEPALGRSFRPADREPGAEAVTVLSHGLWQRRYGGDPGVLGRRIELDGRPHTVVGVMPAGHRPLEADWQLWTPLAIDRADARDLAGSYYLQIVGRLAPGASVAEASAEVAAVATGLHAETPRTFGTDRVDSTRAVALHDHRASPVRGRLGVLLAAVGCMLLVACANVANLLLARAARRRGELAVRRALGAGGGALARQLLLESVLLGLAGGAAGLLLAGWTFDLLVANLPADLPARGAIALDGPVLAFALAVTFLATLLAGAAPAWRAARADAAGDLARRGTSDRRQHRAAQTLVAVQVAAAVILLVAAGLLLRSFDRLRRVDPGFTADGVLAMHVVPPASRYASAAATVAFWDDLLARLDAIPGVDAAGAIHLLPLEAGNWSFPYRYEGQVMPEEMTPLPTANFRVAAPGYFRTLGVPLLAGRAFTAADRAGATEVGMINRTLAETLWPGESAVGKTIDLFGSERFTVVGVVGDVRQLGLALPPEPEMYRPLAQWAGNLWSLVAVARTTGDGGDDAAVAAAMRAAVAEVDPAVPVQEVTPLPEVLAASAATERFSAVLVAAFALLALVLGTSGVHAVVSYAVAQETAEIGVRMALGADRTRVVARVVGRGLGMVGVGLAVGLAGAAASARFLDHLLFGVTTADPATYAAVVTAVALAALAGLWRPARRASAVDPVVALRAE